MEVSMKKWGIGLFAVICILLIAIKGIGGVLVSADTESETIAIGYVQVREYSSFAQQLLLIAKEFEEEGSIEQGFFKKYEGVDYDQSFQDGDTLALWKDICQHNTKGAKYCFVENAFFDMSTLTGEEQREMVNREDINLTLVMGTDAGIYFSEHETQNPYMVLLAADPIASGIVKSETERFNDLSYALIDNTSYIRQLKAGYQFLNFQKLGIVYEDSEAAYAYSAIDSVKQAAEELGFEVLIRHVDEPKEASQQKAYYENLKQAYRELIAEGMDTLYLTVSSIDYKNKLRELLEDAIIPEKILTLAQDDRVPVIYGALFGVSLVDYAEQANHIVTQIRDYVENGISFAKLDQVCECTPKIYVNYSAAKEVGFEVKFTDLQIIDKVYFQKES